MYAPRIADASAASFCLTVEKHRVKWVGSQQYKTTSLGEGRQHLSLRYGQGVKRALNLSSSGLVIEVWVRILVVTLVSLSKMLYYNCFSLPRGINRLILCFKKIGLYTPQGTE